MLTENEVQQIEEELGKMSYTELMETLMRVELIAAQKQNKIVFSECDYVQ
jgi:hypothetical protein